MTTPSANNCCSIIGRMRARASSSGRLDRCHRRLEAGGAGGGRADRAAHIRTTPSSPTTSQSIDRIRMPPARKAKPSCGSIEASRPDRSDAASLLGPGGLLEPVRVRVGHAGGRRPNNDPAPIFRPFQYHSSIDAPKARRIRVLRGVHRFALMVPCVRRGQMRCGVGALSIASDTLAAAPAADGWWIEDAKEHSSIRRGD